MKPSKRPCTYCRRLTALSCPECSVSCCPACGANLCPLCVRITLVQIEQTLRKRLVPWQYVDVTMMPIRRMIVVSVEDHPQRCSIPL
ncbi:hypothetical protein [Dictyobacter arantiisoli]|uniref:hypothetical protein n=1 Tax=Dictyobacter arantiisoli TaxID=2014874 RepID=UPI0011EC360F|nr:hypothetical protein [Dictyobacter arantiisoli]